MGIRLMMLIRLCYYMLIRRLYFDRKFAYERLGVLLRSSYKHVSGLPAMETLDDACERNFRTIFDRFQGIDESFSEATGFIGSTGYYRDSNFDRRFYFNHFSEIEIAASGAHSLPANLIRLFGVRIK